MRVLNTSGVFLRRNLWETGELLQAKHLTLRNSRNQIWDFFLQKCLLRSMIRVMFSMPACSPFTTSLTCKPPLNPHNSLPTVNPIYRMWAREEARDKSRRRSILAGQTNPPKLHFNTSTASGVLRKVMYAISQEHQPTSLPHTIHFGGRPTPAKTFFKFAGTWMRNFMPWYKTCNKTRTVHKRLTCFVDAWIVTELQHVEVSTFHAPADAVDAGDVGTLALDREKGSHHLLVSVVLEVWRPGGQSLEPQQERPGPDQRAAWQHGPVLLHKQSATSLFARFLCSLIASSLWTFSPSRLGGKE